MLFGQFKSGDKIKLIPHEGTVPEDIGRVLVLTRRLDKSGWTSPQRLWEAQDEITKQCYLLVTDQFILAESGFEKLIKQSKNVI